MSLFGNPATNVNNKSTHVYLDVAITNDKLSSNGDTRPIPVDFNDTRTIPYLACGDEYFMSVVRFSIESNLPVAIPEIQLPQNAENFNQTVFSFTFNYTSYDALGVPNNYAPIQKFMIFEPENIYLQAPTYAQNPNDILFNDYFYVNSVQTIVDMMNKTLKSCYDAMALIHNGVYPLGTSSAPYLVLDEDTNKLTFYGASDYFTNQNITTDITRANSHSVNVFMNASMYNWLNSFPTYNLGFSSTLGQNYLINFKPLPVNGNIVSQPFLGANGHQYNYYTLTQSYSSVPAWVPVSSIVLTSSLIPVEATNVGAPKVYTNNPLVPLNNANLSNVISDFEVPLFTGLELRGINSYSPTAEYRLSDLRSNTELSRVQISFGWKDKLGNLHPMVLLSGQSANCKILFRKKIFNNC
jgi:hypothetical protein